MPVDNLRCNEDFNRHITMNNKYVFKQTDDQSNAIIIPAKYKKDGKNFTFSFDRQKNTIHLSAKAQLSINEVSLLCHMQIFQEPASFQQLHYDIEIDNL